MSPDTLKSMIAVALLAIAITTVATERSSNAQQQWRWPEKPENLQVLNKDWSGSRLSPVMRGFTRALGVRCSYCHVGEEGKDLSTYDFVSDANPNKNRAREMLRMLGTVNDHLKKIEPSGQTRVNMWCHTCHRGRPRPMTLEEELGEQYRSKGIDAAVNRYHELKKDFLERGAYDFSERSLNNFGYELLEKDNTAAIRIFSLNTEIFDKSPNVWDSLAEAHSKAGNIQLARRYYKASLKLNPNNDNARQKLKQLEGK